MVKLLRYLLFPFSLLYGGVVAIRNLLFDKGILKSSSFDLPVILVGNLSAGGTGKTPHIEYLIRLLSPDYKVATLSRGYGRKSTGFIRADKTSTYKDIGDEPLQFYMKHPNIEVNVEANRVNGIVEIMSQPTPPQIILLDDAFQHRQLQAGLSILLTDYNSLFYTDFMLPTGNLREFPQGKKRADIIVITKCPATISEEKKKELTSKINTPSTPIFFSRIGYSAVRGVFNLEDYELANFTEIVLVTGIANAKPMVNYLKDNYSATLTHLNYPDHHSFSQKDVEKIIDTFAGLNQSKKLILTTEKDAMRLKEFEQLSELPVAYLAIEIDFIDQKEEFNSLITTYVTSY